MTNKESEKLAQALVDHFVNCTGPSGEQPYYDCVYFLGLQEILQHYYSHNAPVGYTKDILKLLNEQD